MYSYTTFKPTQNFSQIFPKFKEGKRREKDTIMNRITLAVVVFLASLFAGNASAQSAVDTKFCMGEKVMIDDDEVTMIKLPKQQFGVFAGLKIVGEVCPQFTAVDTRLYVSLVRDGMLPASATLTDQVITESEKMISEWEDANGISQLRNTLAQANNTISRQAATLRRQAAAIGSLKNQLQLAEADYEGFKEASIATATRLTNELATETAAKQTETELRKTAEAKAEAASSQASMWGWVSGFLGFLCVSGLAFGFVFLPAAFDKAYKNGAKSNTTTTATPAADVLKAEFDKGHTKGYAEGRVSGAQDEAAKLQDKINAAVQQALMVERAATHSQISELQAKLAAAIQQQQHQPLAATGTGGGGNNVVPFPGAAQPPASHAGPRPAFTPPPQPQPPTAALTAEEERRIKYLEHKFKNANSTLVTWPEQAFSQEFTLALQAHGWSATKEQLGWFIAHKNPSGQHQAVTTMDSTEFGQLVTKCRSLKQGETLQEQIGTIAFTTPQRTLLMRICDIGPRKPDGTITFTKK